MLKIDKNNFKQFFLCILAIVLICFGYINYNTEVKKEDTLEVASSDYNELSLGDVEFVNSDIVPNDNLGEYEPENNKVTSVEMKENLESNYFEESRIQREKMYSEMIDIYQKLIQSEDTPEEQKTIAVQEITNITNTKNAIMIAENLIKNKGFEDAIVLVNSDNVNVVVNSSKLNQEEISKIQNIIQRELKVDFSNISITNK